MGITAAMSGSELEKLVITACDECGNPGSAKVKVLINPQKFSHQMGISYDDDDHDTEIITPMGNLYYQTKFKSYNTESVGFDLVMDGTGTVKDQPKTAVSDQLDDLKKIVYLYSGKEHEPSVVQLAWGDFTFLGRLTTMDVDYTLFESSGKPLRAHISLKFRSFMSVAEEVREKNNSSPDMTHIIEVKQGDTLPILCQQVYRQSRYYSEIARVNGLNQFRDLEPGTRLVFPPLA